jgi:hypothetical protein
MPYPGQGQPMVGAQPPAPPPPVQPVNPRNQKRSVGELGYLYGAMGAYGVGTGLALDFVAKIDDPALAVVPPLLLGAGAIVGTYFWDREANLKRGVPASTALGITLGLGEGLAIVGTQSQLAPEGKTISLGAASGISWLTATGGGIGGYFFGEYLRPDTRGIGLIAMGSTMGSASGMLFGMGVGNGVLMDGGSVGLLLGLNLGMVGTAIASTTWTPSWKAQKWMWAGYGIGVGATVPFYLLYAFRDSKAGERNKFPLFAVTGLTGLVGATLAAVFTADLQDDADGNVTRTDAKAWKPPFQLSFSPNPGGGTVTAFGQF